MLCKQDLGLHTSTVGSIDRCGNQEVASGTVINAKRAEYPLEHLKLSRKAPT